VPTLPQENLEYLVRRHARRDARVADENIQSVESLFHVLEKPLPLGAARNIRLNIV
jgi:hypothetical protein